MTHGPRLVLIGDVGGPQGFHVGDEAMLEANLDALRALVPGLTATVVSRDPAWTSRLYGVGAVPTFGFPPGAEDADGRRALRRRLLRRLRGRDPGDRVGEEAMAAVAASDGVVVSGGGNLSASWPEQVHERAALCEAAHAFGKPVVFLGQTIGPALCPETEGLLARALSRARLVGVRELASAGAALALGVPPGRLHYQTDDALFLEPCPVEADWARPLRRGGPPWIAVTFDPLFAGPDASPSLDALAAQLAQLAERTGARLVFVPHVAGPPSDPQADATAARALAALLPPEASLFVCDALTSRQTKWLTGQADLVVSTRYHPLVFGLAEGTPGVGVVTDEYRRVKLHGALAHAELGRYCLPLAEAAGGGLLEAGLSLWARRAEIRVRLGRRADRWRRDECGRWRVVLSALRLTSDAPAVSGSLARPLTVRLLRELDARRRFGDPDRQADRARMHELEQYARSLEAEVAALRHTTAEAERYARSLAAAHDAMEAEVTVLRRTTAEAERYALSLAAARDEAERHALSLAEARSEAERYALALEAELHKHRARSA